MVFKHALAVAGLVTVVAAAARDAITGVSWGAQRIDVFGADSEDDVFHKYYTAFGWGPDDPKHGSLELFTKASVDGPVTVASWGPNRLDFVFVDTDGNARHKYWDGSSWGPGNMDGFELLGAGVEGKLALSSWGENRFDVFGLSADQTYVHKAWTGYDYYPPGEQWESLGGEFASPPVSVSWGLNRIDVFGITNEGNVSHKYWDGSQWQPEGQKWEDLGGKGFSGRLTASSPYLGRFDVWAVSDDTGELYHLFWDGLQYHAWENLGGTFINAPQVVHWSPSRIDILGKDGGKDSQYVYKFWDGYQWHDWQKKGGPFASEPALVNIGENNLNLFGIDRDGKLKLQVYDGSQWLPDYKGWYELGNTKLSSSSSLFDHETTGATEKVLDDGERDVRIELRFKA